MPATGWVGPSWTWMKMYQVNIDLIKLICLGYHVITLASRNETTNKTTRWMSFSTLEMNESSPK